MFYKDERTYHGDQKTWKNLEFENLGKKSLEF